MTSLQLCVATGNAHKISEISDTLQAARLQVEVLGAQDYGGMVGIEETGENFAENAQIKAEGLRIKLPKKAPIWVLADDSGLIVPALNNRPGIYSARYAGENATDSDNNEKLLKELESCEGQERAAFFSCHLCLLDPRGKIQRFEGHVHGHIAPQHCGKTGFGYDPLFVPRGYTQSFAELGATLKNEISHRAKAMQALIQFLKKTF